MPEQLLEEFRLSAVERDYAATLSGGQRKLLEMARALMAEPTIVMLDEPMAGVNPALVQSLLGHITELRAQGMTVVFVEHDMDVVMGISDWVVCMAEGRVIAEGPPSVVGADPVVIDAYLGTHTADAGRRPDERRQSSFVPTGIVAGYLPGVDILRRLRRRARTTVRSSASSGPTARASRRSSRRSSGWCRCATGRSVLRGEAVTNRPAHELVERGVGYVPQRDNVFPRLTIEENLQMGLYLRPERASPSGATRCASSSRGSPIGCASARARCRAASARWSPWRAR